MSLIKNIINFFKSLNKTKIMKVSDRIKQSTDQLVQLTGQRTDLITTLGNANDQVTEITKQMQDGNEKIQALKTLMEADDEMLANQGDIEVPEA